MPVIVSGANARDSVLDNVHVVGGRRRWWCEGRTRRFSAILWPPTWTSTTCCCAVRPGRSAGRMQRTALECSNITYMPGISLALARADENVVFDECPALETPSFGRARRAAARSRRGTGDHGGGQPMFDWKTQSMPPACSTECLANETGTYCYQGYAYSCRTARTGESAIEPTEVDEQSSFGNC